MVDFAELQKQCHRDARNNGWWDGDRTIPELLCLIHSEVSEALEDFRNHSLNSVTTPEGKPVGFPTELADIVIRTLDFAEALEIDLTYEIQRKLAYNKTRGFRHGNKLA